MKSFQCKLVLFSVGILLVVFLLASVELTSMASVLTKLFVIIQNCCFFTEIWLCSLDVLIILLWKRIWFGCLCAVTWIMVEQLFCFSFIIFLFLQFALQHCNHLKGSRGKSRKKPLIIQWLLHLPEENKLSRAISCRKRKFITCRLYE